jgi:acyl-CoA synthetase (AMP-forming)/AMP-acid ligase II
MAGYLDDRGRITVASPDGWFETGDLARIEADGTIHLRGRDSEVINVSGLKVVPCEVEEILAALPGVVEVKVYAGRNRSGTQAVKAAVAVENGMTVDDLRAHCDRHLVYYKRPNAITLVDALPRTPAGKIDRQRLP